MALKSYNPVTPSRRNMTAADYSILTTDKPEKSLTVGKKSSGGRNNYGRVTTRFRGGANKRSYRLVDFKRNKDNVPATVKSIEYDPNRTAYIALICYADGEKAYILLPNGLNVGDVIMNGAKAELKPGNCLKIKDIPVGVSIHNIEMIAGRGAKLVRSAGQYAVLRVVMNPVDHPMGGGEGRTSGGGHPVSPWGQLAKGYRTRSPKKTSSKFIVERRKK